MGNSRIARSCHVPPGKVLVISDFDAIVIGSGMGALTFASLFAQLRGGKVLVLERHFKLGGFTHTFKRKNFTFDVGLHYVGEMAEGRPARNVIDFISGSNVEWRKIPSPFDEFHYPDISVCVPDRPEQYPETLINTFPAESESIRAYFKDVISLSKWFPLETAIAAAPPIVASVLGIIARPLRAKALQTTQAYLTGTSTTNA